MNLELKNKTIIVSGAASGIGSCIFEELLKEGASPIGIDLKDFQGSELEQRLRDSSLKIGHDYEFFSSDAANEDLVHLTLGHVTNLDGLVNNAGLLGSDSSHGGRSIRSFRKMMTAHSETALVLTEFSYRRMKNGGSIVNIGSIETIMAAQDVVLYTSAKGDLWGKTVAYAMELAPYNIRVNMVSPGNVNTEKNKAQYVDPKPKEILRRFEARTPLGRSVEPIEIADPVLFFLSKRANAITGTNLIVDAGYTRQLWDPGWSK
ncbi:MAG: SDR family NAD(P)-dependent oxidoreductase [Candidatus Daviesbacteria bacterium]|nr:SDR family NAD(P)-dependent oxidoreductase [Candidatus Daviesbacteria bacterium]